MHVLVATESGLHRVLYQGPKFMVEIKREEVEGMDFEHPSLHSGNQ